MRLMFHTVTDGLISFTNRRTSVRLDALLAAARYLPLRFHAGLVPNEHRADRLVGQLLPRFRKHAAARVPRLASPILPTFLGDMPWLCFQPSDKVAT
jgi:hypothetical protein